MITEVFLFLIIFILTYTYFAQDPPDYPPGPLRIPIIGGGVPNNDERCAKQQKKYGDIILDKIGKYYWLTVCDFKLVKEAYSKTEFADRPQLEAFMDQSEKKMFGVINTNGTLWRGNRRFVLHYLKDKGMGRSSIEDSVQAECKALIAEFKLRDDSTTSLAFMNFAPFNIIWKLVANKRYNAGDPMLERFHIINQQFSNAMGPIMIMELFPVLKKILPKYLADLLFKWDAIAKFDNELKKFTQPVIDEHKQNVDGNHPKDLMDQYAREQEKPKYLAPEHISDIDLQGLTNDLFNAGTVTVSITLHWAILFLAKYPQIQTKLQEEIDRVVPRDVLPGYEHKIKLPYCEAFIHETLRRSSLLNFLMRMNSKEIYLGGYRIPKNTIVTAGVSFIHHDPRYWKNPNEFQPERFIDENGKFCSPKEGFLPFGIGKRQCVGEGLARAELYIFLAALAQNFTFSPPEGQEINVQVISSGFGFQIPISHEVHVHARK